jgi:Zn-dependent protease with chaperone function
MHAALLIASLAVHQAPVSQVIPPEAQAEPLDVQKATDAWLATLSTPERAKSDAYAAGGYWLELWGWLANLGAAAVLLATGLSSKMRALAERLTRRAWLHPPLYALLATPALAVLGLPLRLYRDFIREHQYGYSTQPLGGFLGQVVTGWLVHSVMTAVAMAALYAVLRRAPRTWWLWGSGVAVLFWAFSIAVMPIWVEPLFNTFTPIQDATIRDHVLRLARANGVDAAGVYELDASRQDSRIDAHVNGLGPTTRILLNDTLLHRASLPQIDAVVAHELGHQVLHHIPKMLLFLLVFYPLCFACVGWAFHRLHDRFGVRWGTRGVAAPAAWPLLLSLVVTFTFLATPVLSSLVRSQEAEADLFAVNAVQQPDAVAQVCLAFAEWRRVDPSPLEELFFYDHPSPRHRIEMAMRWKREHQATQSLASSPR